MASDSSKRFITHSEDFHTDDVFATALLLGIFPDAEVVRSRDPAVIATGDIVYDVGRVYDPAAGRYDHHQIDAGKRPNGIVYSAFGLLWREYGVRFCGGDEEVARKIDQKLVAPIDAIDNGQTITTPVFEGVQPFTVDDVVGALNPPMPASPEEFDAQFKIAVEWAAQVLRRLRDNVEQTVQGQRELVQKYNESDDKRIIVMDRQVSVTDVLDAVPELLYLISPRIDSWGILALPVQPHSFETRRPFPSEWRGKLPEELARITGIPDAVFCHATGFFAVAKSRESALEMARRAL